LELVGDVLLVQQRIATLAQSLTAPCPHITGHNTEQTHWW